jgi:hypothetical protein
MARSTSRSRRISSVFDVRDGAVVQGELLQPASDLLDLPAGIKARPAPGDLLRDGGMPRRLEHRSKLHGKKPIASDAAMNST